MEIIVLALVLALYLPTSIYFVFKAYREGLKLGLSVNNHKTALPKITHADIKHERKIEKIKEEKEVIEAENEGQRMVREYDEAIKVAEAEKKILNDVTEALDMSLVYTAGEDDGEE